MGILSEGGGDRVIILITIQTISQIKRAHESRGVNYWPDPTG
jgi:hypothetical protein